METSLTKFERVAQLSGLTPSTCQDMMTKGYVYIVEIGKPARWEQQF